MRLQGRLKRPEPPNRTSIVQNEQRPPLLAQPETDVLCAPYIEHTSSPGLRPFKHRSASAASAGLFFAGSWLCDRTAGAHGRAFPLHNLVRCGVLRSASLYFCPKYPFGLPLLLWPDAANLSMVRYVQCPSCKQNLHRSTSGEHTTGFLVVHVSFRIFSPFCWPCLASDAVVFVYFSASCSWTHSNATVRRQVDSIITAQSASSLRQCTMCAFCFCSVLLFFRLLPSSYVVGVCIERSLRSCLISRPPLRYARRRHCPVLVRA